MVIPIIELDVPGATPRWVVHCDRCGTWSTPFPAEHRAIDEARTNGWHIQDGSDDATCPDCLRMIEQRP